MKLISIVTSFLVTSAAHALTLNISYPEGVPEGKVTAGYELTLEQSPGQYHHFSSSTTYKNVEKGLNNFISELARHHPVQDENENANVLTIALVNAGNVCMLRQVNKLEPIYLELFKDGHCVLHK